jgi:hypothetical protein
VRKPTAWTHAPLPNGRFIKGRFIVANSTIARTNTKPGELEAEFWIKLVGFGIGPLIGWLTNIFPALADFLFSWLEPGLASLK